MFQRIVVMALPMVVGTLILFSGIYEADLTKAWTISLTTLAMFQWFNAWNCRSETKSLFQMDLASNKFLVGATLTVIGLQIMAVYAPFMNTILRTTPLTFMEWMIPLAVATSIIFAEELRKLIYRNFSSHAVV